jgi:AraC-like DNA-binding protein
VRDSDVVPAGEASPWLFDDVELFFDTRHDRSPIRQSDDKQIIVTPRGRIRPWLVDIEADTQYVWSARVRAAADTMGGKEGNGYRIELAIPWRELIDDASAATRMRMGFDLFNSDRDGRHSYRTGFSWAQNPRHNNSNPSQWGTLVLRRPHETPAWLAAIPLLMAAAAVIFWFFYRSRPEKAPAAGMSQEKAPTTSEKIVADARAYIEEHFTDESLRLADVARGLGLNANYLSGVFKKTAGVSFPRYLNGVRVREAKRLLRTTSSAVSDIALAAGFSSPNALQRAFRQLENTSPREYRRKATAS